jgi:hypothetical protein
MHVKVGLEFAEPEDMMCVSEMADTRRPVGAL